MLVGAEQERQQEVVERMRIARLDEGPACDVDRRVVDREPVAAMGEEQDLALEARIMLDAPDEDHMVAAVMLGLAGAFEVGRDAREQRHAAMAGLPLRRREFVEARTREARRERHLIGGEHVDGEMARLAEHRQGSGPAIRATRE